MEHRPTVEPAQGSSDRSFGFVFTIVFALVGLWPLLQGHELRLWALALAAAFLLAALLRPVLLSPLNRIWYRFGMLLHAIVSPVALGVIFFLGIVPMGLLMRALGRRPLNLAFDRDAQSYWVKREPPGPEAKSMSDPF